MPETIEVFTILPASPERLYTAWLSSKEHADFTGGKATVKSVVGGRFTAWDGYIHGKTLELEPNRRIVQSWRTTEFPTDAPDSRIDIRLEPVEGGTRLSLLHTSIPDGQGVAYREGWFSSYFTPMQAYFAPKR